jgi:hypothetical protein
MAADRAPSLRPLGIGDNLDELFAVYRRGFKTFVGMTALVQVPLAILGLPFYAASSRFGRSLVTSDDFGAAVEAFGGIVAGLTALVVLLSIVGGVLLIGATSYATSAIYLGQQPTIADAFRYALPRFWALVRLGLLIAGAFLGIMVLSMLPMVFPPLLCLSLPAAFAVFTFLVVGWSLAAPALVLEDRHSAVHALGRSRALVRGAWWRTAATLILLLVLVGVIQMLASGLLEALVAGLQAAAAAGDNARPEWLAVLSGLLQSLASVLYGPLMYIGLTLVYYDRRVRAEAYDLTVLARELAQEPPPEPAGA